MPVLENTNVCTWNHIGTGTHACMHLHASMHMKVKLKPALKTGI